MSERKPAPGRVWTNRSTGNALAACGVGGCPGILWAPDRTLGSAGDMLRAHLRTRHADLWERCEECDGLGRYTGWPHTTCPTCHGRGYTENERSDR